MIPGLRGAIFLSAILTPVCGVALAHNGSCWGDESRADITCMQITEPLLLSLRGQKSEFVQKQFDAPGIWIGNHNHLHFMSNFSRGTKVGAGDINVVFENDRAVVVNASVDTPETVMLFHYVWSAYQAPALGDDISKDTAKFDRLPFCSDLSKRFRCDATRTMEFELTKTQVSLGLSKLELRRFLRDICYPQLSMRLIDPEGQCAGLLERLR